MDGSSISTSLQREPRARAESFSCYKSSCPPLVNVPTCIVLVGLPARGKTFIAKKLARYLNWIGVTTKVFNVGDYRRRIAGTQLPPEFFNPDNSENAALRRRVALQALEDVSNWLLSGNGQAAVFDATNSTRERRQLICEELSKQSIRVFFVESVCNDPEVIDRNIRAVKLKSADFVGCSPEQAIENFKQRIAHYERAYQPLDIDHDKERSFVTICDVGLRFVVNRIVGHLQSRMVYFLMNLHTNPRTILLTRHGESLLNRKGKIGGNSELSESGWAYARALGTFIREQNLPGLKVWSSQLKRTIQTAKYLEPVHIEPWTALNEIDAGECDGLSYEEIQERFSKEFALRDQDKFRYRYPRGESYQDLVTRLEPVIMELERQNNVLVICHQAVMRCLLAYFLDKTQDELPYLEVPLHTVIELTPQAYGCHLKTIKLCPDIPVVNTHRPKPEQVQVDRAPNEALSTVPAHE